MCNKTSVGTLPLNMLKNSMTVTSRITSTFDYCIRIEDNEQADDWAFVCSNDTFLETEPILTVAI